jgi:hypothetical protein
LLPHLRMENPQCQYLRYLSLTKYQQNIKDTLLLFKICLKIMVNTYHKKQALNFFKVAFWIKINTPFQVLNTSKFHLLN